jgi:hypothetical protein
MIKTSRFLIALCSCLAAAPLVAGPISDNSATTTASDESTEASPFDFELEYAYVGDGSVERSFRRIQDFDENYFRARFVYRPRIAVGLLRLGAEGERFDFGMPDRALVALAPGGFLVGRPQLPDTLQSVSGIVGLDTKFSDSILFRIEALPGYYGTRHLDSNSFRVPVIMGGSYIYNANLQFTLGASIDYDRSFPVLPGGGVRWRFAPNWVLDASVPTPRLEYEATRNFMIYAGANLKGSTYRTGENFGVGRGDLRLNNAVLSYTEVRTGLGAEWKISSAMHLSVEGGYLPYRSFDFRRADVRYTYDKGAPYGAVALRAAF